MSGFFGFLSAKSDTLHKLDVVNKTQAVIEFEPSGNILTANSNFLNAMGYTLGEIQGQHHSMFVFPETRNGQDYANFWNALRRGETFEGEFKRMGKGNQEIWIHGSYSPLMDSSGRVYKVIKFARDITTLKHQEMKNRVEANVASALKLCQANVMLADNDLNIVYMNDTLYKMLEHREQDLQKEIKSFSLKTLMGSCVDMFHKKPSHQRDMISRLTSPHKAELKIGEMWFDLIVTPWVGSDGQRLGSLVEWLDKTEAVKKRNEELRLAAANQRIKESLDVCNTSVMIADADFNIIYMNKAVESMMQTREHELRSAIPGFKVSELLGINMDKFHQNPSHQRRLAGGLTKTYKTEIKVANLTFGLIATPILDASGSRIGTVVEWEDKTERLAKEREDQMIAAENARVKQALDSVTTNVMIADGDANIIYMNNAVGEMMKKAEADLRKVLPNFDAAQLKGKNMDIFHRNPSHQRDIMKNLTKTYHGKAEVAGRTFTVIANPVFNDGKRIGTVVEWADRTAEVAIENEVATMIASAGQGDFSKQIDLSNKEGFFANLGRDLNLLVSTVEVALNDIRRMLGAMSKGDLSERLTREYQGTFGQLKEDANTTADRLTEIISNIRVSSGNILTAANEIAQGNADLSQRTEEQASSLEETASSMEEMTATVKQSAENAQKASELSKQAQMMAKDGGQVVSKAVVAMDEISRSSKKISDIIGVIDEIAFQTNLLALNAAVEAARAGEQGRGFAVVAAEVRNLAQRSAGAAKEIKDLIRDSVSKVQDGQQLVNASGETLNDIVSAVENVNVMMQSIASAALEQTSGIEQVNAAVSQMDQMTQQNAALVEEASAASASMADQANNMNTAVDFFTLGGRRPSGSVTPKMNSKMSSPAAHRSKSASRSATNLKSLDADDEWQEF